MYLLKRQGNFPNKSDYKGSFVEFLLIHLKTSSFGHRTLARWPI